MPFFTLITNFFNHPFFIVVGGLTVCLLILGLIYKIVLWTFEITPIVFRFGIALWKRKIAIVGSTEAYESLKDTLIESGIFNLNKIVFVPLDNTDKAKDQTVLLVDWESSKQKIEQLFSARKNHQTAIVIYAKPASIPPEVMVDIANRPNTVVVNFRGRLLNDILTCLVTTSYDRK